MDCRSIGCIAYNMRRNAGMMDDHIPCLDEELDYVSVMDTTHCSQAKVYGRIILITPLILSITKIASVNQTSCPVSSGYNLLSSFVTFISTNT